MISVLSSSLFNLGIMFIIFSAIIYIIKNKISEMEKKINTQQDMIENIVNVINLRNNSSQPTVTQQNVENITPFLKPLDRTSVSDDDDDDESDDDESDDDDDESNEDDNNDDNNDEEPSETVLEDIEYRLDAVPNTLDDTLDDTNDVSKLSSIIKNDTSVLQQDNNEIEEIKEELISTVKTIDLQNDQPDDNKINLNVLTVKELKKMVGEKGGKVSGKTKDELIEYLKDN
tara:strand:- start:2650 stop:3339 length:690 start_codon:yes stop_codon:yes gene_type:complete